MRQASRRESARAWIRSGAAVSIKAYARRYGVDRYTAYDDLVACGFPVAQRDSQWAVRPPPTPRRRPIDSADAFADSDEDWIGYGDDAMFVVGYTSGGAPFGFQQHCAQKPYK